MSLRYLGPGPQARSSNAVLSRAAARQWASEVKVTESYVDRAVDDAVAAANPSPITQAEMNATLASYLPLGGYLGEAPKYLKKSQLEEERVGTILPGYNGSPLRLDGQGRVPEGKMANYSLALNFVAGRIPTEWSGTPYKSSPGNTPLFEPFEGAAWWRATSVTINSPGYRYSPLVLGYVEGKAGADSPEARLDLRLSRAIGSAVGLDQDQIVAAATSPPGLTTNSPVTAVPQMHSPIGGVRSTIRFDMRRGYGSGTVSASRYQARLVIFSIPVE